MNSFTIFDQAKNNLMAPHCDLICVFNLNFTMIFFFIRLFAEDSMDQDGDYSKQQIGSLTTEGEGEF
jgi:hypothetical protein